MQKNNGNIVSFLLLEITPRKTWDSPSICNFRISFAWANIELLFKSWYWLKMDYSEVVYVVIDCPPVLIVEWKMNRRPLFLL